MKLRRLTVRVQLDTMLVSENSPDHSDHNQRENSMAIFVCSQCGHTEETPDDFIGRKARCLNCKTMGTIQSSALQPEKPTESRPPASHQAEPISPPLDFLEVNAVAQNPIVQSFIEKPLLISLIVLVAALLGIQFLNLLLNNFSTDRWEYAIISPDDSKLIDELNLEGDQGWEVVSTRRASGYNDRMSYEMILKRKK